MGERFKRPAALVLGSLLLAGTTACASGTYGYRPSRNDGYQQIQRRAYDNGYREGIEHGRDDARRGRTFSFERHDEYRDADQGFRRGDGVDRDRYREMYRDGFRAGYTDSYRSGDRNRRGGVFGR